MKQTTLAIVGLMTLGLAGAAHGQTVLFEDTFDAAALAPQWQVVEGQWNIADGALTNTGGGLIALNQPPGGQFELEAEINFPPNWMSLILYYESPNDYGTLYFGGGYWEFFEMDSGQIGTYVQHRDTEITHSVDHQIKVAVDHGRVALFYDGKPKPVADLRARPGAPIAFRNLEKGGLVRIKSVRLTKPAAAETKVVRALQAANLTKSVIYADHGLAGKPVAGERLTGDLSKGLELKYALTDGEVFESRFARIPLEAPACRKVLLEVEGDGSANRFFLIVHDRSGEQHLVAELLLSWQGWQEVGVNLAAFLESPPNKQRLANRWGGDESQLIDFPITAVDIGVAKRGGRTKSAGRIAVRALRFLE